MRGIDSTLGSAGHGSGWCCTRATGNRVATRLPNRWRLPSGANSSAAAPKKHWNPGSSAASCAGWSPGAPGRPSKPCDTSCRHSTSKSASARAPSTMRCGLTTPSRPQHHCVFQVTSFIAGLRCRAASLFAAPARCDDRTMPAFDVRPLSEGFGAEIGGIDLACLSDAEFASLERVFYDRRVLGLRAQTLTPAQFVAFARRVGPPQPHVIDQFHHPDDPNILILSNVVIDDEPQGLADAGTYFHTDYSYLAVPARATLLYSIEVPTAGGCTLFANQYAAYDDLPGFVKERIEPLVCVHRYGNRHDQDEASRTAASPLTDEQKAKMPLITHPLVRTHPVTGRKALYAVSGSSFGIVGMPDDEACALLDELAAHATQPKYVLSFAYGVGDVVIWDNASLLHSATLTDPDDPRTLWRITVKEPLLAAHDVLASTFVRA